MLIDHIDELRSKPKEVRVKYSLLFSTVVTGIVVIIWLFGLFLTNYGKRGSEPVVETGTSEETQTTSQMFEAANPFKDSTEGSLEEAQNGWTQELRALEEQESVVETKQSLQNNVATTTNTLNL